MTRLVIEISGVNDLAVSRILGRILAQVRDDELEGIRQSYTVQAPEGTAQVTTTRDGAS